MLNLLGVICHIEGKFEWAIELFERSLKINPTIPSHPEPCGPYNDLEDTKRQRSLHLIRGAQAVKHKHIEPC